ncbi:unnamed protein product [Mytilus coruscus]|uniref:Uncharacterized protein n=1 Tax=Mytilus coruscus TaxID=42192 RepID=A0A6J8BH57_MYTCO|nr:unnamed protein product [Mytilus coruscus]
MPAGFFFRRTSIKVQLDLMNRTPANLNISSQFTAYFAESPAGVSIISNSKKSPNEYYKYGSQYGYSTATVQLDAIDEIVLSYVISILEDLGDDQNAEENINVDQFTEMMDAYIPGLSSIDRLEDYNKTTEVCSEPWPNYSSYVELNAVITGITLFFSVEICEWMFSLSSELSKKTGESNDSRCIPVDNTSARSSPVTDIIGATALPQIDNTEVNGNVVKNYNLLNSPS